MGGRTDGRTDRLTGTVYCPAYFKTAIAMLMGRARVTLTMYSLWAAGFDFVLVFVIFLLFVHQIVVMNKHGSNPENISRADLRLRTKL